MHHFRIQMDLRSIEQQAALALVLKLALPAYCPKMATHPTLVANRLAPVSLSEQER